MPATTEAAMIVAVPLKRRWATWPFIGAAGLCMMVAGLAAVYPRYASGDLLHVGLIARPRLPCA